MGEPLGHGLGPSWVSNTHALAAGRTEMVKVHPGTYGVFTESCDEGFEAWIKRIRVDGPTEISIGGVPASPRGVRHVALETKMNARPLPAPSEGGEEGESGEQQGGEEEAPAESSSSSDESPSSEPAPAGAQCLPHGAVCSDAGACCAGMTCASRTKFSDGSLGNGYCQ
jgi:hypothetical protein